MLSESSDEFIDDCRSGSLNFELLVNRTSKLYLADAQFDFGFFLDGEEFWQKVNKLLRSLTLNTLIDDAECFFGRLEGKEGLDGGMITLSWTIELKLSNVWIYFWILVAVVLSSSNYLR